MARAPVSHPVRSILPRFGLVLLLAIAAVAPLRAQSEASAAAAAERRILTTLEALTAPELDGRLTGSAGNDRAAAFLADRLDELRAEPLPGADTFLHSYSQPVIRSARAPELTARPASGDPVTLRPGLDFDVLVRDGTRWSGEVTGPLRRLTPERARASWIRAHADSVLVVSAGYFEELARNRSLMAALFSPDDGPRALALVLPEQVRDLPRSLAIPNGRPANAGPMLVQLTHAAGRQLFELLDAASPPRTTVRASYQVETRTVSNVAGVLSSGASGQRGRPVVLCAHFDGPGRASESLYYPGAVDNASGVAVVLEAARDVTAGPRPLWVVLFNGEEQGLYGSRAFADAREARLGGATVINVDMVGHDPELPLSISAPSGAAATGELADRLAARLEEAGLTARTSLHGMSDHVSFGELAAAASVVQAPYRFMHTPVDGADVPDAALLARIADAVRMSAESYLR
jgi:hypothetical protein